MMTGENGSSHGQSAQQLVKFMDIVIDSCVLGGFITSTEALQRRTVKPTAKRIYMPPKREGRYLCLVYIMFIFDNENCHWRHVESGRRRDFFLVVRDTQDFFYYWKRWGFFVCPLKSSFRHTHARKTLASFSIWCWCASATSLVVISKSLMFPLLYKKMHRYTRAERFPIRKKTGVSGPATTNEDLIFKSNFDANLLLITIIPKHFSMGI